MFIIKKIFSQFLYPVPLLMILSLLIAIIVLLKRPGTLYAKLILIQIGLFAALSFKPLPDLMVHLLEKQNPTLHTVPRGIKSVVVLGGGSMADPAVPLSSQLSRASLTRLVEGIALFNQIDSGRLIVTGGAVFDSVPIAVVQRRMAIALGVDSTKIFMADKALDTEMEAIAVRSIVGDDSVVLVTSALHMPRASALFSAAGVNHYRAPTEFKSLNGPLSPFDFTPSGENMQNATTAMHEYLGLIWSGIRGKR